MSSGTIPNYRQANREIGNAVDPHIMVKLARIGMTPRQQELNRLWSSYRCVNYEARRCDWNGLERADPVEHESIATAGFVPPGFYAAENLPLKFRKPSAPYYLGKVIVDRFTGLLFSEKRHPKLRLRGEGDENMESFLAALAEAGRLWPNSMEARTFGGAMGSTAVGFQFVDGRLAFEVFDPRWLFPVFEDRWAFTLAGVEIRYMYPEDMQNPETGLWERVPFWYRRTIDKVKDVLYKPEPVEDGEEPLWEEQRTVEHGLGFCPVVWTQNYPVQGDIDGDPDCHGVYDLIETIDTLFSQANRALVANCDPTVVAVTDAALDSIRKGSGNAIKLPAGSSANYMEINGAGPKAAVELAERYRDLALEVAQCVLEHPNVANRTATEVERSYGSMYSRADVFREQYGERLVKPLMRMVLLAMAKVTQGRQTEEGIERGQVFIPGFEKLPQPDELMKAADAIYLQWPPYVEPSAADAQAAAQAAAAAKLAGILDTDSAANYAAPFFKVEDVNDMLARARAEKEKEQQAMDQMTMQAMNQGGGGGF